MKSWDDFEKKSRIEAGKLFEDELRARANGGQVTGTASSNTTARAEVSVRAVRSRRVLNGNIQKRRQVSIIQQTNESRSQPHEATHSEASASQPSTSKIPLSTCKPKFTISQLKLPLWQPKASITEPQPSSSRQADLMESAVRFASQLKLPLKPLMEYIKEPPKPNRRGQREPYYTYIDEDFEEITNAMDAENSALAVRRRFYKVPMTPIETYCNCKRDYSDRERSEDSDSDSSGGERQTFPRLSIFT